MTSVTIARGLSAFLALTSILGFAASVSAQPPLEDFIALASKDEKPSNAAAQRLAMNWTNAYGRPKCPPGAPRRPAVVGIDWQTALFHSLRRALRRSGR